FSVSAMNRLPELSTAIPVGVVRFALVAGPPSPLKPRKPLPATVVMMPEVASTRRMRALKLSAMNRSPAASTATPSGKASPAAEEGKAGPAHSLSLRAQWPPQQAHRLQHPAPAGPRELNYHVGPRAHLPALELPPRHREFPA